MPSTPSKGRAAPAASSPAVPLPASPSISSPSSRSPVPQNYHPYQIQTTASSLLTRSNSSPLQPVSEYRHRSSRSLGSMAGMSSLSHSVSDGELAMTAAQGGARRNMGEASKEGRRRSIDGSSPAPAVPKLRRSGTLPVFPKDEQVTPTRESIPENPKHWSPAHLARYLAMTLRNGDAGHSLPDPLVKDIEAWVLRQQVTGRAFLKGQSEPWATSARAPPFLPVLLNISRRLRRTSLQSRLGDTPASPIAQPDSPLGSILIEADEDDIEDEDESGVRRMARAIERPASAASSASSVDGNYRPRLNSSSIQGWREWESRGVGWVGRRRKQSGASSCADPADRLASIRVQGQERNVSGGSETSATSATSANSGMSAEIEVLETPLDVATIKAPPVGLGFTVPVTCQDGPEQSAPSIEDLLRTEEALAPNTDPVQPIIVSTTQESVVSPHMSSMLQHQSTGAKPYASIRLASGSRAPSLRSMRQAQAQTIGGREGQGDEADDEMAHLSTARRVTLRPAATDIFSAKSEREAEMEKQIADLAGKVRELEEQLVQFREISRQARQQQQEQEQVADSVPDNDREAVVEGMNHHDEAVEEAETGKVVPIRPATPFDMLPEGILARLGLIPEQEGLPTRMRELPAYLFFVGMGVGAVMVKVLFTRAR